MHLWDCAVVHVMVQSYCITTYGWCSEVYVKGPKGRGFLDLLDYSITPYQYYEVKYENVCHTEATKKQMTKYDEAIIADSLGNRLLYGTLIGKNIVRGDRDKPKTSFTIGKYHIRIEWEEAGLISYYFTKTPIPKPCPIPEPSEVYHSQPALETIAGTIGIMVGAALGVLYVVSTFLGTNGDFGATGQAIINAFGSGGFAFGF